MLSKKTGSHPTKIRLGWQFLFLIFVSIYSLELIFQINSFEWKETLVVMAFQFILQQLYFLFTNQMGLTLLRNAKLLIVAEILSFLLMGMYWFMFKSIVTLVVLIQYLLTHSVLFAKEKTQFLIPLVYVIQIWIYTNLLERANSGLSLNFFSSFNCILVASVILILSSQFHVKLQTTIRHIYFLIGVLLFLSSIPLGLFLNPIALSHLVLNIILGLITLVIPIIYKRRLLEYNKNE